jgi:hypothetical protein
VVVYSSISKAEFLLECMSANSHKMYVYIVQQWRYKCFSNSNDSTEVIGTDSCAHFIVITAIAYSDSRHTVVGISNDIAISIKINVMQAAVSNTTAWYCSCSNVDFTTMQHISVSTRSHIVRYVWLVAFDVVPILTHL